MATKNSNQSPEVSCADPAVRHVLQPGGESRAAISECEQAAHAHLLDARQRARPIHDRTDQRISNMEMKAAQRASAALQKLEREKARD